MHNALELFLHPPVSHTFGRALSACAHRGSQLLRLAGSVVLALYIPLSAADNSSASAAALKVLLGTSGQFQQMGSAPPTTVPGVFAPATQPSAAVAAATPRATVTVQRGETLDRLIRRTLPTNPLHPDLLRAAFVNANPQVFPKGAAHAMRSGTSLQVPSTEDLRQLLATQHPEFVAMFSKPEVLVTLESSTASKPKWVRFP